jgi:hypothetical protein
MLIAADNIDKLLAVEMRRRGIPRGFKWRLFEIAREAHEEPLCLAAARLLAGTPQRIAIFTGAWIPGGMPVGESDGPYGAVVLARALDRLGHHVTVYTDVECAPPIGFLIDHLGVGVTLQPVARDDATANDAIADASDVGVAIERLGENVNGKLYSMNAHPVGDHHVHFDHCFRAMSAAGKPTIGITDGGNEIGYGKVRERLVAELPGLNLAEKTACGGGIVSATPADVLVVANSSNHGAYGVVAALALLHEDLSLCHEPELDQALHHVGVGLGLIDGGGGGAVAATDGVPAAASAAVVRLLRNVVEQALMEPRSRPF